MFRSCTSTAPPAAKQEAARVVAGGYLSCMMMNLSLAIEVWSAALHNRTWQIAIVAHPPAHMQCE
jgi:hypothetical protein